MPQDEESDPLKLRDFDDKSSHDDNVTEKDTPPDKESDVEKEHDRDTDSERDPDACTLAETQDTESETETKNKLHDKLEPVEHDSEGDILEHDVLPDTERLDDENETLTTS